MIDWQALAILIVIPALHTKREIPMSLCKKARFRLRVALGNDKGQGLVEYALILVLIAIAVFAMVTGLGVKLNSTYETINSGVANAGK
jgi:pilus assembly protein Flp/PilA